MKIKHLIIAILVLSLLVCSMEYLIQKYKKSLMNEIYMEANSQLSSKVLTLKSIIDRNFNLMIGLEAYVTSDYLRGQSSKAIQNYLAVLYGANNSAFNVIIAPDGIASYIYPLKGNEYIANWDFLHDPRTEIQKQLQRAFSTKQITVNGPFQLLRGSMGIVTRKALFQKEKFWGFVSVGLDLNDILTRSGMGVTNSGELSIAIRSPGKEAFYGNDGIFYEKNLTSTITLADGIWEIAALPKHELLQAVEVQINWIRSISLLILLLAFSLFYYILSQRDRLSAMVESRTQELRLTNEELTSANKELMAGEEELRDQFTLLDTYNHALKKSEQRLSYLAYHDVLTGIANRAQFQLSLTELLNKSDDNGKIIPSVIFFDLDNFKIVNDSHGHQTGDQLLREVTERICTAELPIHLFARFGGDEFAILVTDQSGVSNIEQISQQILGLFKEPFVISQNMFFASPSMGIASYPDDGTTFEALFKHADIAMYTAKKEGGNTYKVFHSSMDQDFIAELEMGNHLRQALERNELEIHFQPQVDCNQGKIIGIEALLRWNHTTQGYISPAVFIPLAEEMGLILTIGEWVLHQACEQMKVFLETLEIPLRLSVNMSVKQLQDKYLTQKVRSILKETGLSAESLELEITENVAMKDEQFNTLNELRNLGITIAVDDFGTHYSSLSYLKRFPVNKIKLDQSFVRGIQSDSKDRAMIQAIIYVAHSFELDIIAEGVETEEQVKFLMENGCYLIQGYYFYRPMEAGEIYQVIHENWKPKLRFLGNGV